MAIINIIPIPGSRSASSDKDRRVEYSASFSILTSNQFDSPNYVGFNQPFSIGEIYDGWPISNINIDETDDPCQWTMTITYGSDDTEQDPNPLNEPWVYSVNYDSEQVAVQRDVHNRPILNTAGDFFDSVMEIDQAAPTLTARRNFPSFPWNIANQYTNTINRDSVFGASPKTLKFMRLSGQQQQTKVNDQDLIYFDVSVEIAFRRDGWNRKVLNQGFREKKDDELVPIKIKGKDITSPVMLKRDGTRAELASPPHVIDFQVYREQNFGALFS